MKHFYKALAAGLFLCALLTGCKQAPAPPPNTVTEVQLQGSWDGKTFHRAYTQPKNVTRILNLVRALDYDGATDLDPAWLPGKDLTVTVVFSDGSTLDYRVHADRYLIRPGKRWEKVSTERAQKLLPYLR